MGEAGDERLAVELLELLEVRAVDDACDELARVRLVAEVLRNEPYRSAGSTRAPPRARLPRRRGRGEVEVADEPRAIVSARSSETA